MNALNQNHNEPAPVVAMPWLKQKSEHNIKERLKMCEMVKDLKYS